eukprot:scaffold28473_cov171-Skeletonema_menzelii.AAC.3
MKPTNKRRAMSKKEDAMLEEELELDEGVMQELLHGGASSSSNKGDDSPSGSNVSSDEEDSNDGDTPNYIYNYTPSKEQLLQQKSLNTQQIEDVKTITEAASQLFHVIKKYGGKTSSSSSPMSSKWDEILTAKNSPWKNNVDAALDEIVDARSSMVQAWDNFHNDSQQTKNYDGDQPKMEWWEPILRSKKISNCNDADNEQCDQTNDDDENNFDEQQFHHVYMEYATNAFAIELEALRRGKLEQMCSTSKKKNKSSQTSSEKSTSSEGMELDLDPTQHSFIVASKKRSGNNDNGDDEEKAAAAEIDVQVLSDMLFSGSNSMSTLERNMLLKARQRGSSSSAEVTASDGLSLHQRRRQELGLLSGR